MTNPYYEVEYYNCLIFDDQCEDDEYKILTKDPEVKAFRKSREEPGQGYEELMDDEDFPENLQGGTLSVWQVVRAVLLGDDSIFAHPETIPASEFASSIIAYAAGFSGSEDLVTTVFYYLEQYLDGEWGPLLVGIAVSGNESLLEYFVETHLEEQADTPYYEDWVQLARKLTTSHEVDIYLGSI